MNPDVVLVSFHTITFRLDGCSSFQMYLFPSCVSSDQFSMLKPERSCGEQETMSFLCSSSSSTRPCPSDLYSLMSYPHHTSFDFLCFFPSGDFSVPPRKGLCICSSPSLKHPSLSSSTSQLVLLPIAAPAPCPQTSLF